MENCKQCINENLCKYVDIFKEIYDLAPKEIFKLDCKHYKEEKRLEEKLLYPKKGDLIIMSLGNTTPVAGTNNQYRVLSINGSLAEVVAMYDMPNIAFNSSEVNTYAGGDLDTYLNTTFYNSLNATAKSAIVDKNITQYQYTNNSSVYNATTHASYADYSTKASKAVVGSRHVYALDVEDIENYFDNTFSTANIRTLFWNTTAKSSTVTSPWLRSAFANYSRTAWYVYGSFGDVRSLYVLLDRAARPALTIDLSKIEWSPVASYPVKGQLITMNLGNATPAAGINNQYRVLSINGSVAEVVAMYDMPDITFNEALYENIYAGGELDTYLNTTFYNSLNATAKSAIVDKTFTQDSWYGGTSGSPSYNGTYLSGSTQYDYQVSLGSSAYRTSITRHVYALSIQDVIDYLGVTTSMTSANTTLTAPNIWQMFWNTTTQPTNYTYPWLRSANADDSYFAWNVRGDYGRVYDGSVYYAYAARPALTIDLSKIEWSRVISQHTLTPTFTDIAANPSSATRVASGGSQTFTLSADGTSYKLPTKITVASTEVNACTETAIPNKCTVLFTRSGDTSGSIAFSNVTDDVAFSVVGESAGLTELCFTANTAGSTVELTVVGSPSIANTTYSRDRITWTPFTPSTTAGTNAVTLTNEGDKVYFRNDITDDFPEDDYLQFVMSGSISASGNVNSMCVSTGFNDLNTLTYACCYACMFDGCTSLTTAPALPATILAHGCYFNMFNGCTSLTTPPVLPATTLADGCYACMFDGCTSLTTAPALPATILTNWCYYGMFDGCTSLTTAPALPATILTNECCACMFNDCTSLQVSDTQTSECQYTWNIPTSGTFTNETQYDQANMFKSCLGTRSSYTMSGALGESHTYYTQNPPIQ